MLANAKRAAESENVAGCDQCPVRARTQGGVAVPQSDRLPVEIEQFTIPTLLLFPREGPAAARVRAAVHADLFAVVDAWRPWQRHLQQQAQPHTAGIAVEGPQVARRIVAA